jgi:adenosine deaminase
LAGPEDGFSSKLHKEAFQLVHENLLNCTLHSGEAASWESVSDSIQFCGAQRIGHGVRLIENMTLTQFVADRRIALEICLTSNLQTKAITSYESHPIRTYLEMGILCVPCTDNSVVSNVTLSEEYHKLQKTFNFTVAEIVTMIDYGFRSAFLDNRMANRLRKESLTTIVKILAEEGFAVDNLLQPEIALHLGPLIASQKSYPYQLHDISSKNMYQATWIRELVNNIPKSDIDCRFVGSVSLPTLWRLFQSTDQEYLNRFFEFLAIPMPNSYEEFIKLIYCHDDSRFSSIRTSLDIMAALLQTPEQIKIGLEDIFREAAKDNLKYLELYIRPTIHTKCGLTHLEFLTLVLDESEKLASQYGIRCGVGICIDNSDDGYTEITNMVLLAVQNRDRICGFGFFGFDKETHHSHHRGTKKLYDMLKKHQIEVCISAGKTEVQSVITALHTGGASRLNGCFAVERDPNMLSYLANHSVPIELSLTNLYSKCFTSISDTEYALRLFFDRGLKIAPCSLDLSLYPQSRNEMMFKMAERANFTAREVIEWILFSFKASNQKYSIKKQMFKEALVQTRELVAKMGLKIEI